MLLGSEYQRFVESASSIPQGGVRLPPYGITSPVDSTLKVLEDPTGLCDLGGPPTGAWLPFSGGGVGFNRF